MPTFKKLILFVLLASLTLKSTAAAELFDTEFNVYYTITESGDTQIDQDIKITNKQNDVVATNYSLTIKDMHIFDATGTDEEGPIEVETTVTNDVTTLKAEFNRQVIGVDRSYEWQLNYKSKDIANKVGEVWHINIPKVEVLDVTKDYNIVLIVPDSFGPKIFVSPVPTNELVRDGYTQFFFSKEALEKKGITASFGNYQVLNYQLMYNLTNTTGFVTYQEIALPPDIPSKQQLYYASLTPHPQNMYSDADGNVLAVFKIEPKEAIEVRLNGSVKITGRQINPEFGGKIGEISEDLVKRYTKTDIFWEVNATEIQNISRELFDLDLTTSQNAQRVYEYVTGNLEYDFDIVQKEFIDRQGALAAITTPGPWACMAFTDLFIAITRAMGIPARELNGYAFTRESNLTPLSISLKSGDLLHSWAEYYDPSYGWVPVDPTWGTTSGIDYFTKLDTNHFVFSIKGIDSEYPFPAGAYKVKGNEKQVEVDVAQNIPDNAFMNHIKVYMSPNLNPIKLLNSQQKYLVYNEKGSKLYNLNNTGEDLLPFSTKAIFLSKGSNEFYYENFIGEGKTHAFTIEMGEAPKLGRSNGPLISLLVVALLLCGIVYGLAIHPTALKTLLGPLRRPPQDQDQLPNQNSQ